MSTLGLSGLASGVDTGGIVDKLMAIERQGLARINLDKLRVQARQTGLKDVSAKLSALKDAATALRGTNLWANTQTITSSDTSRLGVERLSETAPGSFSFTVLGLAKGAQKSFNYTQSLLPSSLTIDGLSYSIGPNGTVDDVVTAINAKTQSTVYAAKVGGQLVLSSKKTGAGAASDFTVSGNQVQEDTAKRVAGQDLRYQLDGVSKLSPTNVVEGALPGVRLTFKAVTTAAVTVTVTPPAIDKDAIKAKLKTFVDAYNAVVTTTREKTTEKTDPKSVTTSGRTKGQLFGDSGLNSILSQLRTGVQAAVTGNPTTMDALADLGISTGKTTGAAATPDALAGKLVLDETKLAEALTSNPDGVKRLMGAVAGVSGFAQRIEALVDQETSTTSGIGSRIKAADDAVRRIDERYARTEKRIGERETRLRAQFAAMEKALGASQTQQAWLSGQLAALNNR